MTMICQQQRIEMDQSSDEEGKMVGAVSCGWFGSRGVVSAWSWRCVDSAWVRVARTVVEVVLGGGGGRGCLVARRARRKAMLKTVWRWCLWPRDSDSRAADADQGAIVAARGAVGARLCRHTAAGDGARQVGVGRFRPTIGMLGLTTRPLSPSVSQLSHTSRVHDVTRTIAVSVVGWDPRLTVPLPTTLVHGTNTPTRR